MLTKDFDRHFRSYLAGTSTTAYVFAPYIQLHALESIAEGCPGELVVVTTWRTRDVLSGASDLSVYPFVESRGGFVYLHSRLHMKVLSRDLEDAIVSTANITGRGLGLVSPANTECAVYVETLTFEERLWLTSVVRECVLVQDDYYEAIKLHIQGQPQVTEAESITEFDDTVFCERRHFLLSSLPMCATPDELFSAIARIREDDDASIDPIIQKCALHDVALYSLDLADSRLRSEANLTANFFAHPFISALMDFVADRRYFGETKAWIQNNCANVPVPRRRKLTDNVRVLFDWVVALGQGKYVIERPSHSECLVKVDK